MVISRMTSSEVLVGDYGPLTNDLKPWQSQLELAFRSPLIPQLKVLGRLRPSVSLRELLLQVVVGGGGTTASPVHADTE